MSFIAICGLIATLVIPAGCSAPASLDADPDAERPYRIHVVRREWHTGIAIAAHDWPNRDWPLLNELPAARYLEFGWGDAEYYQAEKKTLRMTLAAVLWPTPSVMEVVGYTELPMNSASDHELVTVRLSRDELRTLTQSIESAFAGAHLRPTGAARMTTEGRQRFYEARGEFHFFRMCNRWTADRLAAAGCAIKPWPVISASRVLAEARRCEANARTQRREDAEGGAPVQSAR